MILSFEVRAPSPAATNRAVLMETLLIYGRPPLSFVVEGTARLSVTFRGGWFTPIREGHDVLCEVAVRTACRRLGWKLVEECAEEAPVPAVRTIPAITPGILRQHFSHVLDREPHIRLARDALAGGVHVLLHGPPSGGKTRLAAGFASLVGSSWSVPALGATQAGFERALLSCKARLLIFEEIEKCKPAVLAPLIELMDERGSVSRLNARDGDVRGKAGCVVLATSNNIQKLGKKLEGAVLSRFGLQLPCPRPDVGQLRAILLAGGGDPKWVDVAVGVCVDVLGTTDPRVAKAVLTGGPRLLDGSYLADLRRVHGLEGS